MECLYRRPGGTAWEPIELDRAMDMVADRVKRTRDETFQRTATVNGREVTLNHTLGIGSLGGATLDNEWNYAQAKSGADWGRLPRKPGPNMTLRYGPRSGDELR